MADMMRSVFKVGAKQAEADLTTHIWRFTTPTLNGFSSRLIDFLANQKGVYKFYQMGNGPSGEFVIGHGTKFLSQFDTSIRSEPMGTYWVTSVQIVRWIQTNGVSPNTIKMQNLIDSIRAMFQSAYPDVLIEKLDVGSVEFPGSGQR